MSTQPHSTVTPISIHIPPNLRSLAIPLSSFLAKNTQYDRLVCSAFIFNPAPCHRHQDFHANANEATIPPRLLLLRRSSTDTAFPNLWEIPGGSVDKDDPTILHGLAREVFEETGLRLTRFVRLVGETIKWTTTEGDGTVDTSKEIQWMKLSFEIEVEEIGELKIGVDEHGDERCLPVDLDPREHQDHAWVTEKEVRAFYEEGVGRQIVSKEQAGKMLEAFGSRRA
ncbi:MAG: hypothetical protein LQ337_008074 [Flavoplaca oasis]|nr:MAG: hypothetical protein LQ337_008074 [Flavoplaca oasis]